MSEEGKTYYIFEGDDIVTYFLRVKDGAVNREGEVFNAGLKLSPKGPTVQSQAEDVLLELQAKAAKKELKVKWFDCDVITKEEYEKEFPADPELTGDEEIEVKRPGEPKRRLF